MMAQVESTLRMSSNTVIYLELRATEPQGWPSRLRTYIQVSERI